MRLRRVLSHSLTQLPSLIQLPSAPFATDWVATVGVLAVAQRCMRLVEWQISERCSSWYKVTGAHTRLLSAAVKVTDCKMDLLKPDAEGFTPVHLAAVLDHSELVQWLAPRYNSVDHCDTKGCAALHYSAASGNRQLVQWLVSIKPSSLRYFGPLNQELMSDVGLL